MVLLDFENSFPKRIAISFALLDFAVQKPNSSPEKGDGQTLVANVGGYAVEECVHDSGKGCDGV